jgi:hypothetical protein
MKAYPRITILSCLSPPRHDPCTPSTTLVLLATLLNTMANASFTVGVAAPVAASVFYGQTFPVHAITAAAVFWGTLTLILHAVGQFVLGGLRRD